MYSLISLKCQREKLLKFVTKKNLYRLIDDGILILKHQYYGIRVIACELIEKFLLERVQIVYNENKASRKQIARKGIRKDRC